MALGLPKLRSPPGFLRFLLLQPERYCGELTFGGVSRTERIPRLQCTPEFPHDLSIDEWLAGPKELASLRILHVYAWDARRRFRFNIVLRYNISNTTENGDETGGFYGRLIVQGSKQQDPR